MKNDITFLNTKIYGFFTHNGEHHNITCTKLWALSGWLQRKQPQCFSNALYSKTSKKRWDLKNIESCRYFMVCWYELKRIKLKFIWVDIKCIYLNSLRRQSCAFAGGKAPVTKVTKEIFSHFKISQQFFNALTELSRVLMAEEERAYVAIIKVLVLCYLFLM